MTGYTVHTGSTEKFSEGWDRIFKSSGAGKKGTGAKSAKSPGAAKAASKGKAKKKKR